MEIELERTSRTPIRSASSGGANCVLVGEAKNRVVVRHSKHREGHRLSFAQEQWTNFLGQVKNDELDL